MSTVELFTIKTFPIWNIMVRSDAVFEISDFLAEDLIHRGVCITMEERNKRLAEKAKKKADQEDAKLKAKKETEQKEELPQPKKTRKSKDAEVSA